MYSIIPPPVKEFTEEEKEILELSSCTRIKVMSFNIKYDCRKMDGPELPWVLRYKGVKALLSEENPAIVCTQEALSNQVATFVFNYVCIGEGRNGGTRSEWCAVLADKMQTATGHNGTFWLSNTPHVPRTKVATSKYNRIASWAFETMAADPAARFLVVSTHTCHASGEARREQARILCEEVDEIWAVEAGRSCPVVVCGDFNEGKVSRDGSPYPEYRILSEAGFRDAWREAREERVYNGYGSSSCHHWNPKFEASDEGLSDSGFIDWVMWKDGINSFFDCGINQHLVPMKAEILAKKYCDIYPSDHFPIAITFTSVPTLEPITLE